MNSRLFNRHLLNLSQILSSIDKIKQYYTEFEADNSLCLVYGTSALETLKQIALSSRYVPLEYHIDDLLWCTVICFKMYHSYISSIEINCKEYKQYQKKLESMFNIYVRLIKNIFHQYSVRSLTKMIQHVSDTNLWKVKYICVRMFKKLLTGIEEKTLLVNKLLDEAATNISINVEKTKMIMDILCNTIKDCNWHRVDQNILLKLMEMYNLTMTQNNYCKELYHSADMCIQVVVNGMEKADVLLMSNIIFKYMTKSEIDEHKLRTLGRLLETVSLLHKYDRFRDIVDEDVFKTLLSLIASNNNALSLLGNYLFQCLFDRHGNRQMLKSPRIFFNKMKYMLTAGKYHRDDKVFLKRHRRQIHNSFLAAIKNHGENTENLENIYSCIALLVTEIPCDYSAVAISCLAMNIQIYTLDNLGLELASSHRLHATVMALLSLVCRVNQASAFYHYLEQIITIRANNAPFLNPPLQLKYQYAQHEVLWNKPELFVDLYEVRYYLWKCFRTKDAVHKFITFYRTDV